MSRLLFVLTLLLPLQSQASEALFAQTLDGGLTWWALEHGEGISEANPVLSGLNGPEILAVKIGVTYAVRFTPAEICRPATVGLTVGGYAATFWGIAVLAGSPGWVGLPLIVPLALWRWDAWTEGAVTDCANPWSGFGRPSEPTHTPERTFGDH